MSATGEVKSDDRPVRFDTMEQLRSAISKSMPDEYPFGMADVLANEMIEKGTAVIAACGKETQA